MRNAPMPLSASFDDLREFTDSWRALEAKHQVDSFGSFSYRRILPLWIRAGKPRPPCAFILHHANQRSAPTKEAT